MAHKDKYISFAELRRYEGSGAYRIRSSQRNTDVLVLSPHGGAIEPGVSEIVLGIAAGDLSYYLFEGRKKSCNYDSLHITSSNFDEPRCMQMLRKARVVLAIHGCGGTDPVVFLGGLQKELLQQLADALSAAGYDARTDGHNFPGSDPRNICNLGVEGGGVQFELTKTLRDQLNLQDFVSVVRSVIASTPGPAT